MVRKKDRIPIVIDTNVFVANYLSTNPKSPNVLTIRLWRERKLQLIVSDKILVEYKDILTRLNIPDKLISRFINSLDESGTVTQIKLGKRFINSRDPKDNLFLSTASAGKAKYLVTNDDDLLEIPKTTTRKYKFRIITSAEFLKIYDSIIL